MNNIKVEQLVSPKSGRPVANQFIIFTDNGKYFQSYNSIIAFIKYATHTYKDNKPLETKTMVYLDETYWDYSKTTTKYRNEFLEENTAETRKKIKSGEYILTNLN